MLMLLCIKICENCNENFLTGHVHTCTYSADMNTFKNILVNVHSVPKVSYK